MTKFSKYNVTLEASLVSRIERYAGDRVNDDGEDLSVENTIPFLVAYALNRIDVLAAHKAKVDAVKRAKKAGKALPKGIAFKRYVPAFSDAKLDAAATEKTIAKWTHAAPAKPAPARAEKKVAPAGGKSAAAPL
jgi:hypothetical protein